MLGYPPLFNQCIGHIFIIILNDFNIELEISSTIVFNKLTKNELINLVLQLKTEKEALQAERQLLGDIENRVIALERRQYLHEQYGRRESVEISGIPVVENQNLEDEVIKVYNEAKVQVFGRQLKK